MKELNDAIMKFGRGISDDIVKVDMFLNHRIDVALLFKMGEALGEHFRAERPTMILTVEASGIALALTTAHALGDIPVVYAKKSAARNQSDDMAQTPVYSYTHGCNNYIRVDRKYMPIGSRVLIVDDFLAEGNAVSGMMRLVEALDSKVCGVGIGVEKGFQQGGARLRAQGIDLKSLAVIKSIEDGQVVLDDED